MKSKFPLIKVLREEYKKCWIYLKQSSKFIYFVTGIFVAFFLIGFFLPVPEVISEQILKFVQELVEKTQGLSQWELIRFIFFNNLQSSFFGLILGTFFGVFTLFMTILNGYVPGFVAAISVGKSGLGILWELLPHGIFELPAIFISFGLGLKLGTFVLHKKKMKTFNEFFRNSIRIFFLIVVPLLIIAAIIEGSLIALR